MKRQLSKKHFIFQDSKAIIYIQEMEVVADVTFPTRPMVVSLREYDDAAQASKEAISGYPVVCITVSCSAYFFYNDFYTMQEKFDNI